MSGQNPFVAAPADGTAIELSCGPLTTRDLRAVNSATRGMRAYTARRRSNVSAMLVRMVVFTLVIEAFTIATGGSTVVAAVAVVGAFFLANGLVYKQLRQQLPQVVGFRIDRWGAVGITDCGGFKTLPWGPHLVVVTSAEVMLGIVGHKGVFVIPMRVFGSGEANRVLALAEAAGSPVVRSSLASGA